MSIASALRQAIAMFYRPLVRLVDVLGRIGLGLLRGRVDMPGEFKFFGISRPEASKATEARAERAEPSQFSQPLVMETGDLPAPWEESAVILLPVNPYLIHAYWYVDSSDLDRARARMDSQQSQAALRFYDITDRVSHKGARASFDVDIQLEAGNWYVHLWSPARSYYVEVGLRNESGRFYPVARSNVAQTPRAFPFDEVEERHVKVEKERAPAETLPPPNSQFQEKAGTSRRAAETSISGPLSTPESPEAEASSVPGLDAEFMEDVEPWVIGGRQPLRPARIRESLEAGRRARLPFWGDEKELVADITANNERRLDFGISSGNDRNPQKP
jgi:hypothetical protein